MKVLLVIFNYNSVVTCCLNNWSDSHICRVWTVFKIVWVKIFSKYVTSVFMIIEKSECFYDKFSFNNISYKLTQPSTNMN